MSIYSIHIVSFKKSQRLLYYFEFHIVSFIHICLKSYLILCYFQDSKFDIAQVVDYFSHNPDGDLAIYYEMEEHESTTSRGVVEVCPTSNR